MQGILNRDQVNNILTSQSIGRIAYCDGKTPYIVPINYSYDGKCIYGQTNEGNKLHILRNNPNVCFEVELVTNMRSWQSVVIQGEFAELTDEIADEGWEILCRNVFTLNTITKVHNHEHEVLSDIMDENCVKAIMFKIHVQKVTGRYQMK